MATVGRYHGLICLFALALWYSTLPFWMGIHGDILKSAIVNVQAFCASNTSGLSHVMVISDAPVFYSYAKCEGDQTYNSTEVDIAHQKVLIQFSGDHTKNCVFNKKLLSQTYTVEFFVVVGTGSGVLLDEQFYLVTCTYDPHGSEESSPKDFSTGLSPAKDVTVNQGGIAKSVIELTATDIKGRPIPGALRMRTKIRLKAEMTYSAPGETSFHPLTCKATGGRNEYAIIVAGCGDGRVIRATSGFVTTGRKSISPAFNTFRLQGARSVTFQCTYYICAEACDGSSCMTRYDARKKREVSEVVADSVEFNLHVDGDRNSSKPKILKAASVEKRLFSVTQEFRVLDEDEDFVVFDDSDEMIQETDLDFFPVAAAEQTSGFLPLVSGLLSTVALGSLALAVYYWYKSKRTDFFSISTTTDGNNNIKVRSFAVDKVENENYEPGTCAPNNFKHLKKLYSS